MKNAIKVICFVLAVLIIGTGSAWVYFKWDVGEFEYADGANKGTAVITAYIGSETDVTVPEKIRGKRIVAIDDRAFEGTDVVNVTVGDNVININDGVFEGCTKLEKVVLGKSVRSLGQSVFSGCTALKELKIDDELQKIGQLLFSQTDSLKTIDFGTNKNFKLEDGVLYSYDMTVIYEALPTADLSDYKMPDSVTTVKNFAFNNHSEITALNLSSNLSVLSGGMYSGCTGLKKAEIPSQIMKIETGCFAETSLQEIKIPATVKQIDKNAFYGLEEKLTIVTVKGSHAQSYAEANGFKLKTADAL